MAVKLHRCSAVRVKLSGHPCWRVQKALNESGVEYELLKAGSAFKSSSRQETFEKTGQKQFPWIEFDDGSVYRDDSKAMAETIRAGKLEEKRASA